MKIHKKFGLGLFLAILLFVFILSAVSPVLPTSRVQAAGPAPGSLEEKLNGCAVVIAAELAGGSKPDYDTNCRFFDNSKPPSECGPHQLYGDGALELSTAQSLSYKLPYREGGYNDPSNPPNSIALVEGDQTIASPPGVDQFKYADFTYTGQMFETYPAWKLDYWVYQSNYNTTFKILLALRPSGNAPVVLTMVNTSKNVNGNDLPVCAYPLNLPATLTTPTGGVIPPGASTETGGVTGSDEACYKSGWALSWVACPVITVAQTLANEMYEFVENQLQFTVKEGKQKDSLGGQDSREQVKGAWNNFRILVSGLVVILMLVMVISQAIGGGLFDAYTVKKMLPRLVAGVILIQLSWPVFSWVINSVDDLGRGLADIIYAPFGGADALNLNKIMEPFVGAGVIAFNWFGVLGIVALGVVAPFLILGLILTVLVAIFAGFLTLLFRKILIILALILVPVALIAWMMPNEGLRRYWKIWWDNFLKALMMYPLIILIIAAGRIFAKIGSGQEDNLIGFFIVLIGFFGPLFILPKTFKWGGTAMQLAGNALTKAQTATLKKPREFLGERQKGYTEERRLRSKERVASGQGLGFNRNWRRGFGIPSIWRAPVDKVLSGQWDPTLTGRRAERALATYKKTGRDAYGEDLAAARIGEQIDWESLVEGEGVTKDDYLQDVFEGKHSLDERGNQKVYRTHDGRILDPLKKTRMQKLAALYEMEKLAGGTNNRHIQAAWARAMASGEKSQDYADYRRFMNDSVGTMLPKMTGIYKGFHSTMDAGPSGVAGQHGVNVEEMLAQSYDRIASNQAILDDTTGTYTADQREDAQRDLALALRSTDRYLRSGVSAASSPELSRTMEQGNTRAFKGFATRDTTLAAHIADQINNEAEDGRLTMVDANGRPLLTEYRNARELLSRYNDQYDFDSTLDSLDSLLLDDGGVNPQAQAELQRGRGTGAADAGSGVTPRRGPPPPGTTFNPPPGSINTPP